MTTTKSHLVLRFLAGLLDYSIVYVFFMVFVYSFGAPDIDGGYSVTGFLALVPMVFWFVFIVMLEVLFGATFGNSIVGLKPRSLTTHSGTVSFGQSLKRHLLDPIDMFPFGLIGYITIKNTEKHQRLGDLWAKTIVVSSK